MINDDIKQYLQSVQQASEDLSTDERRTKVSPIRLRAPKSQIKHPSNNSPFQFGNSSYLSRVSPAGTSDGEAGPSIDQASLYQLTQNNTLQSQSNQKDGGLKKREYPQIVSAVRVSVNDKQDEHDDNEAVQDDTTDENEDILNPTDVQNRSRSTTPLHQEEIKIADEEDDWQVEAQHLTREREIMEGMMLYASYDLKQQKKDKSLQFTSYVQSEMLKQKTHIKNQLDTDLDNLRKYRLESNKIMHLDYKDTTPNKRVVQTTRPAQSDYEGELVKKAKTKLQHQQMSFNQLQRYYNDGMKQQNFSTRIQSPQGWNGKLGFLPGIARQSYEALNSSQFFPQHRNIGNGRHRKFENHSLLRSQQTPMQGTPSSLNYQGSEHLLSNSKRGFNLNGCRSSVDKLAQLNKAEMAKFINRNSDSKLAPSFNHRLKISKIQEDQPQALIQYRYNEVIHPQPNLCNSRNTTFKGCKTQASNSQNLSRSPRRQLTQLKKPDIRLNAIGLLPSKEPSKNYETALHNAETSQSTHNPVRKIQKRTRELQNIGEFIREKKKETEVIVINKQAFEKDQRESGNGVVQKQPKNEGKKNIMQQLFEDHEPYTSTEPQLPTELRSPYHEANKFSTNSASPNELEEMGYHCFNQSELNTETGMIETQDERTKSQMTQKTMAVESYTKEFAPHFISPKDFNGQEDEVQTILERTKKNQSQQVTENSSKNLQKSITDLKLKLIKKPTRAAGLLQRKNLACVTQSFEYQQRARKLFQAKYQLDNFGGTDQGRKNVESSLRSHSKSPISVYLQQKGSKRSSICRESYNNSIPPTPSKLFPESSKKNSKKLLSVLQQHKSQITNIGSSAFETPVRNSKY